MTGIEYTDVLAPGNIFDSHAHYDDKRYDEIRDELFKAMTRCGVTGVITCGCDIESSRKSMEIAHRYDCCSFAAGFHPENLDGEIDFDKLKIIASDEKCVAIGEIGLDYYWRSDNTEEQKQAFSEQIAFAKNIGLPVIVHDRDAHADTLEILKNHKPCGVLHCFSGSPETAAEIIKLGMYIGVGGVVTFKNARKMPEVVKMIPDDRLLLETDSPYLAPEPFRGKICHSGMIALTAARVAEIRETSAEKILELSQTNAKKLFKL